MFSWRNLGKFSTLVQEHYFNFIISRIYLIFEYLLMDLKKYMDKIESGKFMDPKLVKSYFYQLNSAILFCHQRRVLHRDLKPQNLLITRDGVIKVMIIEITRLVLS